jgi:hypothetical protein
VIFFRGACRSRRVSFDEERRRGLRRQEKTEMQYLLLIYEDEKKYATMTEAEQTANLGEWYKYSMWLKEQGNMKAGDALQPVSTATTVRKKGDKVLTTDGPFAETREQLGGYYLIEAADLEEAIRLAAPCPATTGGSVEIRPVMKYELPG